MGTKVKDNGVRPPHYKNGMQPIELFNKIDETDYMKFCLQNAIKYLNRDELKNSRESDVAKLGDYIGYVVDSFKAKGIDITVEEVPLNIQFVLGKDFSSNSPALKTLLLNSLVLALMYIDNADVTSTYLAEVHAIYPKYLEIVTKLESGE